MTDAPDAPAARAATAREAAERLVHGYDSPGPAAIASALMDARLVARDYLADRAAAAGLAAAARGAVAALEDSGNAHIQVALQTALAAWDAAGREGE